MTVLLVGAPDRALRRRCREHAEHDHPRAEHRATVCVHRCACRIFRPGWSGGVPALVDHSSESIVSADVEVADSRGVGDWFGRGTERCCLVEGLVWSMCVVVLLELAQCVT
ncbi:MAG TPA: hypothetical protein VHV74_17055 [Pseudonocardiaceae bacterium]|nr:hypothetical protein [Pseudonocardiaceae bacterium]